MTHLALLHRARTAIRYPDGGIDKQWLLKDLDKAIKAAYPKPIRGYCWCGENAVDGKHCTFHSDLETGDG